MSDFRRRLLRSACVGALVFLALAAWRVARARERIPEGWVELPLPATPPNTVVHVVVHRGVPAPGAVEEGETWHAASLGNGEDAALAFWPAHEGRFAKLLREALGRGPAAWLPTEQIVRNDDGRCFGRVVDASAAVAVFADDRRRAERLGVGFHLPRVRSGRAWEEAVPRTGTAR